MNVNIAFVSPQIYPCYTGGIEIFNYCLVKELATQKHNIFILTCCNYDWKFKNVYNIKLHDRLLLFIRPSITINTLIELKKLKSQIDIVHVPYVSNSLLAFPLLLAKKLFGIRYLISIHGGGMYEWKQNMFHKSFFKEANTIVAASTILKEEYEKRSKRKIKVIPPLIPFLKSIIPKNELRKTYGFSDLDLIILSLGSIKPIKGSDILLKAFLNLKKEYIEKNHLKLFYVGDGETKKSLKAIVKKASFEEYVKFYGLISYERVPEIYKLTDIYVIPSLFEGTPKSLLEAMFNNLPIIGSDTNGINNVITHNKNGLLFKTSDVQDLTNKLKTLVEDSDLRERLGRAANVYVRENYNYEKTLFKFIEAYKSVINEKQQ